MTRKKSSAPKQEVQSLIDAPDKVQALCVQAEKVQLENEVLFRKFLEEAPDGVYMNDLEGKFLYVNRKSEEIIGCRREELIGKNFLELNILTEKSLARATELLQANIKGESTGPDELEIIRKDGRRVPVEVNTNVIQQAGKKVVLAFARDISERKQSKETIHESGELYNTFTQVSHPS